MTAPMRLVVMVLLVLPGCDKKAAEPASEEATKTTGAAGSAAAPAPGRAESDEGARVGGAAGGIAAGLDDIAGKAPRQGSAAAAPPTGTTAPPPPPPPATVTEPQPQPGSGSAAAPAPPIAITDTALTVGDRVMARWTNGSWYPGKIVAITADGKYDVNYDDGDKSRGLPPAKVRKKSASTAGGGKPSSGGGKPASDAPCPGPGITRRCNGVCVNIQENNNHCGGCNNRCPSGKACDGHMFCRDAEGNL